MRNLIRVVQKMKFRLRNRIQVGIHRVQIGIHRIKERVQSLTLNYTRYFRNFLITCTLIAYGFFSVIVVVSRSKSSLIGHGANSIPSTAIQSTVLSDQRESQDSQKIGNGVIKEEVSQKTSLPFLSLSSSIIPVDLNQVLFAGLFELSYHLIIQPLGLGDFLIEDWNENFRQTQLVYFFKDIRDHLRLRQIDCLESFYFYAKILQGPRSYSDWVKKEELLHQEKSRLNCHLQFRKSSPVKRLFTRHGSIYVYPWINDKALKRAIKERSQFETQEVRRFFYKNYRRLLDKKLPLGAIFELDPSFKKSIQQSFDFVHLRSQPIVGGKDSLRVPALNLNLFFDPNQKEIKIESPEPKTDEWLVDCFAVVFRLKFTDPNRIELPGPQPNNFGLSIRFGFEQRHNLTLKRKLSVVLTTWYLYRNRRYLF